MAGLSVAVVKRERLFEEMAKVSSRLFYPLLLNRLKIQAEIGFSIQLLTVITIKAVTAVIT